MHERKETHGLHRRKAISKPPALIDPSLFPISYSNYLYIVFQNKSGLTIIQQRSPVLKSCKAQFVQNLLSWIRKEGFQEVLILGS